MCKKRQDLTKEVVLAASYDPVGPNVQYLWSAKVPGFGVRLYPSGKKSYVDGNRPPGKYQIRFAVIDKIKDGAPAPEIARKKAKRIALKLLLVTAQRWSEIVTVRWVWVHWDQKTLTVPRMNVKNRKETPKSHTAPQTETNRCVTILAIWVRILPRHSLPMICAERWSLCSVARRYNGSTLKQC